MNPGTNALTDRYRRQLTYLRVSITDRCNLKCAYCAPPGTRQILDHADILRYEEILRLVRLAVTLGITKVRVTGGEPLVRRDATALLAELTKLRGIEDVSLTTNAVLLSRFLPEIQAAGIRRLNISLDTLVPDKYRRITGADRFHQVWEGIEMAQAMGFAPIKINAVVLRGVNDDELVDLARLTLTRPWHVRFIEYMPIGDDAVDKSRQLLAPEILKRLGALGPLRPLAPAGSNAGPAERFAYTGAAGEVGIIHAISRHFCARCNRLRLTAAGALRPCLLSDYQVDLKEPLRQGFLDTDLAERFVTAAAYKSFAHQDHIRVHSRMSSIGG